MMRENDIFSWNSIVSVHEQCGDHDGTLRLLNRMLGTGIQPDLVTVTTILPTCSHLVALMHGREIHGYMIVSGLGKDGKNIDDVLLKMYLMHNHFLQNPLIYMMSQGIQMDFLKLEININLTFQLLIQNLIIFGLQYPTDAATVVGTPHYFLFRLLIPIMWVSDEIGNIENEPLELHGAK